VFWSEEEIIYANIANLPLVKIISIEPPGPITMALKQVEELETLGSLIIQVMQNLDK